MHIFIEALSIRHISFTQLKDYWIEVDHFQDPNKVYTEVLTHLGPYRCEFENPRRFSYGLFFADQMIGATHLTQWNSEWVRFRTINIREPYRGQHLGEWLIKQSLQMDWQNSPYLFGWLNRRAHAWAKGFGLLEIDGKWHGDHIGMLKPLSLRSQLAHPSRLSL